MSPLHSTYTLRTLGALNPPARELMLAMHEQANGHGASYDGDWSIQDGTGDWEKICESSKTGTLLTFQLRHGPRLFTFRGTVITLHKIRSGFPTATLLISLEGHIINMGDLCRDRAGTITIFWNTGAVRKGFVLMPTRLAMGAEMKLTT